MITDESGYGSTEKKLPCVEKEPPFAVRHPVLRGLLTVILGFVAVAVIDIIFFKIGGMEMVASFGIVPIAIGVLFVLKGYMQMTYPARY